MKFGVYGRGLACILGLGAVFLAYNNNKAWEMFLLAAVALFILPMMLQKPRRKKNGRRRRR